MNLHQNSESSLVLFIKQKDQGDRKRSGGEGDSPWCQQVADWVPGTDEDLWLMAPQDHGLVLRDLHVSIHLHQVCVVVWAQN